MIYYYINFADDNILHAFAKTTPELIGVLESEWANTVNWFIENKLIVNPDKLNFNLHISNICKSTANQLNATISLKVLLSTETKKVLINSYFFSNFNIFPFVWMLSTPVSKNIIENL